MESWIGDVQSWIGNALTMNPTSGSSADRNEPKDKPGYSITNSKVHGCISFVLGHG